MSKISDIQTLLGVTPDGIWGPRSQAALQALIGHSARHAVLASSFADPADVRAYHEAKARGLSDEEAFKVGDNGIGKWGDDTTADRPMCALPPEDWMGVEGARGKLVRVEANGAVALCELRDTMPAKAHITNGCGIDLNPAAAKALGLHPPFKVPAVWSWA
jgi:hypothetical protein